MLDGKVESDFNVKTSFNTISTVTAAKKEDLIVLLQSFHVNYALTIALPVIVQFYLTSVRHGQTKIKYL